MRRLSFLIIAFLVAASGFAQQKNTHGDNFKVDCKACHNDSGWEVEISKISFKHETTKFPLEGRHAQADCKSCHNSLVFTEAKTSCASCHQDVHNMSVGNDCARCHGNENWLVDNIPELHEQNGFFMVGAHAMATCIDCHKSETNLRWDRIGNNCSACHIDDYNASASPNHKNMGFSTDCEECHDPISMSWGAGNFHTFFPLTGGHNLNDCNQCHNGNDYSGLNPACISCHQDDYNNATSPNHAASGFSTNCALCHTLSPGWSPATMADHDPLFPIYSGKHKGTWNSCTDCHTNPNSYATFSCTDCHEHSNAGDLADEHDDVSGYSFVSSECYRCHPKGEE